MNKDGSTCSMVRISVVRRAISSDFAKKRTDRTDELKGQPCKEIKLSLESSVSDMSSKNLIGGMPVP